ncbi:hypothetical protein Dip510_000249 [Elusimicrobium posterum]|uniref:hypothetical protein n=1 Tax=Elusimicrobium posterum TaxID=3116653 RepID=UPI003C7326C6
MAVNVEQLSVMKAELHTLKLPAAYIIISSAANIFITKNIPHIIIKNFSTIPVNIIPIFIIVILTQSSANFILAHIITFAICCIILKMILEVLISQTIISTYTKSLNTK